MSKNILLLAPSCSFKWWSRRAARPPHPPTQGHVRFT